MNKVMNKDLWAYDQYQSDTKIKEEVKVDSQGMPRQADWSYSGPYVGWLVVLGLKAL